MSIQRPRLDHAQAVVRRPTVLTTIILTTMIMMTVLMNGRNIKYSHPSTTYQRMFVTGWAYHPIHQRPPPQHQKRIQTSSSMHYYYATGSPKLYPFHLSTSLPKAQTQQRLYSSSPISDAGGTSVSLLKPLPITPFDDGQRPYQITTPIYYVNDKPHIGHAYTSTGTYSSFSLSALLIDWYALTRMLVSLQHLNKQNHNVYTTINDTSL
jgi:hypothetical protein